MLPRFFRQSLILISLLITSVSSSAADLTAALKRLDKPGNALIAEATRYREKIEINGDQALVPASILKILTAYLAIQRWGLEHRFTTEFYQQGQTLWIKGLGDPYLTSGELELIASVLRAQTDLNQITHIKVDNSFFPDLSLDGRGNSDNPYDAGNAALAVNFNSVFVKRHQGVIISAESETPLTPLAKSLGEKLIPTSSKKAKRVSLPGNQEVAARYVAELFSEITFNKQLALDLGQVPKDARLVYTHQNSQTLEQVLRGMLKYSNNYIANQLFLLLASDQGQDINIINARANFNIQVQKQFGWQGFVIHDGAGLSRKNRLNADQMMRLLEAFRPWAFLLPEHKNKVLAKTGTMKGIRTYAGYYQDRDKTWRAFTLLMNKPVEWRFRYKLAEALAE